MKKLLSIFFMMSALLQAESQEAGVVCGGWKCYLQTQWCSLSSTYQYLIGMLLVVTVIWTLWRLLKCRKGSCNCNCGEACNCRL